MQEQDLPNTTLQSNTSIRIVQQVIQTLLQSFSYQLKVRSLTKHIPQFNTLQLHELNQQCVAYFYLQGESKFIYTHINMVQDKMPMNITKDGLVNKMQQTNKYQIGKQNNNNSYNYENDSIILPIKIQVNNSLDYSLSKSRYDQSRRYGDKDDQNNMLVKVGSFQVTNVKQFKQYTEINLNNNYQSPSKVITTNNQYPSPLPQQLSLLSSTQHLIPLNLPQKEKPNYQLQTQLQHLKKNLYQMRRYRRISIEQQRANIDLLNKKKSHLFVNKHDHTYDYDGGVIQSNKKKSNNKDDSFQGIIELKPTLVKSNTQRNKLSLNKKLNQKVNNQLNFSTGQVNLNNDQLKIYQDTNPQRNLTSQQKSQKVSFNNGNKRQISHLPFISLKQNSKMIQNKKQLSGCVTQRNSLNRSKLSMSNADNSNKKFRSFSQIELQKKLQRSKQKVLDLTQQQSDMLGIDILPPTLNLHLHNQQPYRKQSKMMQKYLKKLTQQKTKIQKMIQKDNGLKSLNFEQVSIPQKYPIQRYYEYDFQGERRAHQYSITSKLSTKRNSLSIANETQPNY